MESWSGNQIEIEPWHEIPDLMAQFGLTEEDGMRQAWFIDTEGNVTGGAECINQSLRYVWWAKPFSYLYAVPGIRQLQEWVYRWVANNRYRMPGSTDACAIPSNEVKNEA